MRRNIRVKTKSKHPGVVEKEDIIEVSVSAPPADGQANEEVIELLADHFEVAKSSVEIIQGLASKDKVVDIKLWQKRVRRY